VRRQSPSTGSRLDAVKAIRAQCCEHVSQALPDWEISRLSVEVAMSRSRLLLAVLVLFLTAALGTAADLPLFSGTGLVVKANANILLVRPRGADGQFGKAISLKLRGTSKVSTLTTQVRDGQTVAVQRDADAKDLKPNQPVAIIYTQVADKDYVLLAAVAQPASR
jgi:hypothetical protein